MDIMSSSAVGPGVSGSLLDWVATTGQSVVLTYDRRDVGVLVPLGKPIPGYLDGLKRQAGIRAAVRSRLIAGDSLQVTIRRTPTAVIHPMPPTLELATLANGNSNDGENDDAQL